MSVHAISWVLKHSEAELGERLVLIVLADHAREDGSDSWPSVETIARDSRLSRSQVQRCLRRLEDSGAITETGRSRSGTHVYAVNMGGPHIAAGAASAPEGGRMVRPDPSLDQPLQTTTNVVVCRDSKNGSTEPSAQTVVGGVIDAFAAHGVPLPKRHIGILARQTKELIESGFDERLLVLAAVTAERRGEPQNMHFVASDMAMARAGQRMTRREYEKALEDEMEVGQWKTATRSR